MSVRQDGNQLKLKFLNSTQQKNLKTQRGSTFDGSTMRGRQSSRLSPLQNRPNMAKVVSPHFEIEAVPDSGKTYERFSRYSNNMNTRFKRKTMSVMEVRDS